METIIGDYIRTTIRIHPPGLCSSDCQDCQGRVSVSLGVQRGVEVRRWSLGLRSLRFRFLDFGIRVKGEV